MVTEQKILNFILENWGMVAWTVSMLFTVTGLIIYNAKVVLPGFVKRMDTMAKDIKELQDKNFVTQSSCKDNHVASDTKNEEEHAAIQKQVDKILICVQGSENARQRAKVHQISFMTAVKEKLDLKFTVPSG